MTSNESISRYDTDCIYHSMDEYDFLFNAMDFRKDGGGRLELRLADDTCVGWIKGCCPVRMDLEDIPEIWENQIGTDNGHPIYADVRYEFPDKWLLELYRAHLERGYSKSRIALYDAAFEAAKMVGAAGVVSEWDEPASKKIWATLAGKHNAVIETRQTLVGSATDRPHYVPVYCRLVRPRGSLQDSGRSNGSRSNDPITKRRNCVTFIHCRRLRGAVLLLSVLYSPPKPIEGAGNRPRM